MRSWVSYEKDSVKRYRAIYGGKPVFKIGYVYDQIQEDDPNHAAIMRQVPRVYTKESLAKRDRYAPPLDGTHIGYNQKLVYVDGEGILYWVKLPGQKEPISTLLGSTPDQEEPPPLLA